MAGSNFGYGQQDPSVSTHGFNADQFQIEQALASVRTVALVKVLASTSNGAVAAPGTVNVQPIVNQLDGGNNATPHGTVYNIPIARTGGGTGGIIADPKEGDIRHRCGVPCDHQSIRSCERERTLARRFGGDLFPRA